ncbi:MAG: GEVED domain-containing protein [Planctomycetaceae bacterium]
MTFLLKRNARETSSSVRRNCRHRSIITGPAEVLEDRRLLTLNIKFDYSMDDSRFFAPQERKDALERAAAVLEARITDTLSAITPGSGNTWTAELFDPATGNRSQVGNLTVAANQIVIFAGARNLGKIGTRPVLGQGSSGGVPSWRGTQAFGTAVVTRGQSGVNVSNPAASTDFAAWGGALAFTTALDAGQSWNFGTGAPGANQYDFFSVAVHEMAHLLGFGLAPSYMRLVNASNQFTGTKSRQLFGGNVPLETGAGHWMVDTAANLPGTSTRQETLMDPDFEPGVRKLITDLDWAGLDDLGWDVSAVSTQLDFGDAPDASNGTGTGNYKTRAADGGASHVVGAQLRLGGSVDADSGTLQNAAATADDTNGSDDENGIANAAQQLTLVAGTRPVVSVSVTNQLASAATLYGWIDYNGNGLFENSGERASVTVAAGTVNGTVTLTFPQVPRTAVEHTYARFRISTTTAAANSTGAAPNGEVEDYAVTISIPVLPSLDVDGNGQAELFTDGILMARYIINFTGEPLIRDAIGAGATRTTAAAVKEFLDNAHDMLDADGNGVRELFTDGILIVRFLVPLTGNSLIQNAIAPDATRTTAAQVTAHLNGYLPPQAGAPVSDGTAFASAFGLGNGAAAQTPSSVQTETDEVFADLNWLDEPTRLDQTLLSEAPTAAFAPEAVSSQRNWLRQISVG